MLMAGLLQSEEIIAAQTLVVAFGDFLVMIPMALSNSISTQVGVYLGQNDPKQAYANFKIATVFQNIIAFCFCIGLAAWRK